MNDLPTMIHRLEPPVGLMHLDEAREAAIAEGSRALLRAQLRTGQHWLSPEMAAERLAKLERRG